MLVNFVCLRENVITYPVIMKVPIASSDRSTVKSSELGVMMN